MTGTPAGGTRARLPYKLLPYLFPIKSNRKLHPRTWQHFFDDLSKQLRRGEAGPFAHLRVVVPGMTGTQDVVYGRRLEGVSYDPRDQALYLMFDGLTHRAERPEVIWARIGPSGEVEEVFVLGHGGRKVAVELSAYCIPEDPYAVVPVHPGVFRAAVKVWWEIFWRRKSGLSPFMPQEPYGWPSEAQAPEVGHAEPALEAPVAPVGRTWPDRRPARARDRHVRDVYETETQG